MTTWYAVYEMATGRLHSTGTVLADPMPREFTALTLANEPTGRDRWDPQALAFVPGKTDRELFAEELGKELTLNPASLVKVDTAWTRFESRVRDAEAP